MLKQKLLFILLAVSVLVAAQSKKTITYKTIDGIDLKMDIYTPDTSSEGELHPAIIFFFGGGWDTGNRTQFKFFAENYVEKGLVTVLADYRIKSKHDTTPIESLKDAKSAMRYLKENAAALKIDTTRLIGSGGSAGGQLAAACFTNETLNETSDNLDFSAKPKFLVLFNPVIDNSKNNSGHEMMGDLWEEISPLHNVKAPFVPTLFMVGSKDKYIPVPTAQLFKQKIENVGGRCDLIIYQGWNHGFFNSEDNRPRVLEDVDAFLESIGCLNIKSGYQSLIKNNKIEIQVKNKELKLRGLMIGHQVQLFSLNGQLLANLGSNKSSLMLEQGCYIIRISGNNTNLSQKIQII